MEILKIVGVYRVAHTVQQLNNQSFDNLSLNIKRLTIIPNENHLWNLKK